MSHLKLVLVFLCGFFLSIWSVANAEQAAAAASAAAPVATAPATVATTTTAAPAPAPVASQDTAAATAKTNDPVANTIQNNNITVGQPSVITVAPLEAKKDIAMKSQEAEAAQVLAGKAAVNEPVKTPLQFTPMAGIAGYVGNWNSHISNRYTFGLALEIPINEMLAIEAEGGMGKYNISYSGYLHPFETYNIGGNAKVYLTRNGIRPYIGAGLMALYYDNMSTGFSQVRPMQQYSTIVGAGQIIGGVDLPVAQTIAIGARGAYVLPLFNRPFTQDNGVFSAPGFEEAGAINTSFYKVLGTVSVAF